MSFADLPVDYHRLLVKYLTIKERVKYARVNKTWADLIDDEWNKQRALWFSTESLSVSVLSLVNSVRDC